MNFLTKYWVQILTLLIAVSGGIPGMISISNYMQSRPKFGFEPEGILRGELPPYNKTAHFIMLIGTVTNSGNKPLNPKGFSLEIKVDDKWMPLRAMAIPETFIFGSEEQNIDIKEPSRMDLQERKEPILIGEPARGCLLFESNELIETTLEENNSITFRLTCVDIFNRNYAFTAARPFGEIDQQVKYPKFGITVGPKK